MCTCPYCQLPLHPTPDQAGTLVMCPQCHGQMLLPAPQQELLEFQRPDTRNIAKPTMNRIEREASAESVVTFTVFAIVLVGLFAIMADKFRTTPEATTKSTVATSTVATKYGDANHSQTQSDANQLCKALVLANLKYPLDAELGWWDSPAEKTRDGSWVRTGTVTALNGFGGRHTYAYVVSVVLDKECNEWLPVYVSLNGNICYVNEEGTDIVTYRKRGHSEAARRSAAKSETERKIATASDDSPIERDLPTLKIIPGLSPADIYQNFTAKGFAIQEPAVGGSVWYCINRLNQREAIIIVAGNSRSDVSGITATVRSDTQGEAQNYAEQIFPLVGDIEYAGADREQAKQWIRENLGKDNVSTRIGGVQFELYAKTQYMRMLRVTTEGIEK